MSKRISPALTDFIRASGHTLVVGTDARPIRLTGVNFPAYGWGRKAATLQTIRQERNFRAADYRRVAALGMNVVRLNLSYLFFEQDDRPFSYQSEGWHWLEKQISWGRAAGVYLILDMHAPQGGYQAPGYQGNFWEANSLDRERLRALWVEVARRYCHESQIAAYGLMNEPCTHDRNLLWVAYAQRLVDSIRAVDENHLIDIEQDVEAMLPFALDGKNLMYDFHCYEPWRYAAQFWRYGFQGRYGDPQTPILPWTWRETTSAGAALRVEQVQIAGAMPLARSLETVSEFEIIETGIDGKSSLLMRICLEADSSLKAVSAPVSDDPYPISPSHWDVFSPTYLKCERLAFPVRRGCTYQISAGLELLPLEYNPSDSFAPLTRETIEQRLLTEYGLQFYLDHELPVNVGEYGLSPHAFKWERGGAQWLADRLDLFAKYSINWQYWVYSGAADFALYDNRGEYPAARHANHQALDIFRAKLQE